MIYTFVDTIFRYILPIGQNIINSNKDVNSIDYKDCFFLSGTVWENLKPNKR